MFIAPLLLSFITTGPSCRYMLPELGRPCACVTSLRRTSYYHAAQTAPDGESADELQRPVIQAAALLSVFVCHVAASSVCFRIPLPSAKTVQISGDAIVGGMLATAVCLKCRGSNLHLPSSYPWAEPSQTKRELLDAAAALIGAFLLSGCLGSFMTVALQGLVSVGVPLSTAAMHALQVLGSHTAWVLLASHVLGSRLKPFFPPPIGLGKWFRISWRSAWLSWAVGGYALSVAGYDAVDKLNEVLLAPSVPTADIGSGGDPIVTALASPEQRSGLFSLAIGCIAPCITAPVFEEVLYRGFLLPSLMRFVPFSFAMPLQAILFGAHHRSLSALLPLSALGVLWAALYVGSANLMVPILVHALWNCRVFACAYWNL